MKRSLWLLVFVIGLSGCASLPVQTSGRVSQVAWSTTALDHGSESALNGDTERFAFTLVLQETAGVDLTLTKITWKIWQDEVDLGGEETRTGSWSLPAHGTLWQPFVYRIFCPPGHFCPDVGPTIEWDIAIEGIDARGEPVQLALKAILPWIPPRTVASSSTVAQARPEVVSTPIHVIARRIYYPFQRGGIHRLVDWSRF